MFKEDVARLLSKTLGMKEEEVLFLLEKPKHSNLGDLAFPCFSLAQKQKKSPVMIAGELARKFEVAPTGISKVQALGPYVNFFADKASFGREIVSKIQKEGKKYGSTTIGAGKKAIVEFSSPNIAKPMSIGHLRNTIIGNSISKILAFNGYQCININYIGDYGTQFGKLLVAYRRWGQSSAVQRELKKNPISTLLRLYTKFSEEAEKDPKLDDEARLMFKMLEDGDKAVEITWKKFRDVSLKEFKEFYKLMGVRFDVYSGESFYKARAKEIIKELKDKKIAVENAGALIVEFKDPSLTPFLVQKSDGTTLYGTRDLAAAEARFKEYKFDKMIYVVGSEQNLHFKQLFETLKMAGHSWADRCYHVNYGMIYIPGVGKMSTRKGSIAFASEAFDKIFELTNGFVKGLKYPLKERDKIARAVGVSAIIYGDLSNDRVKDIKFDWEKLLRLEGDSGPYLQYTYARAKSILRKLKSQKGKFSSVSLTPEEEALVMGLSEFPHTIRDSAEKFAPSIITGYLLTLAEHFNSFYEKCPVMNAEGTVKETRAALTAATAQIMQNGMLLLGMIPLERM